MFCYFYVILRLEGHLPEGDLLRLLVDLLLHLLRIFSCFLYHRITLVSLVNGIRNGVICSGRDANDPRSIVLIPGRWPLLPP